MTDEQRRADLIARWHAEEICTEEDPAHDCPCDRPKGGGLEAAPDDGTPCSPGCPGWALFDEGTDREAVQRCDDCARFEDDSAALAHVVALAQAAEAELRKEVSDS